MILSNVVHTTTGFTKVGSTWCLALVRRSVLLLYRGSVVDTPRSRGANMRINQYPWMWSYVLRVHRIQARSPEFVH
jgi:hypothetical protein